MSKRSWWSENKENRLLSDQYRNNRLKSRYNITLTDYENLVKEQENKCLICNLETDLHVDHCHSTGRIRGLLCANCNNGLGCFKDNSGLLQKAKEYLDE